MNSKHIPCPHAASGCNWPESECLDLCTPVQMHDDPIDITELDRALRNSIGLLNSRPGVPIGLDSRGCNEIPAPTSPIGGWGSVIRIFNRHAEK